MKRLVLFFIILLLITSLSAYAIRVAIKPKSIHYHAGFHVYVDGKLQDFSADTYMSLIPCGTVSKNPKIEQLEKAHLHDNVGDVVHVHRKHVIWNDLFKNINFPIDTTKPPEGYINSKKVAAPLQQPITAYDSLVLFIGTHGKVDNYLQQAVTKQHVQEVEKHSEPCGTNN